jgi:hypothetical protein
MVFMAMRKPPLLPQVALPTFRGLYGTFTDGFLRAADLWKPATFWKPLIADRGKGGRSIPRGKHDRVAAADGPAVAVVEAGQPHATAAARTLSPENRRRPTSCGCSTIVPDGAADVP